MKPMLARTLGPKFNSFPCYVQPKLNGERVLEQNGDFQSRGEKLWKPHFFPLIREQVRSLNLGDRIPDGEFYKHGWRFQRINKAIGVNNHNPNDDTTQIELHVFDVVDPSKTFSERYLDIRNRIIEANLSHVKAVDTEFVISRDQLDYYFTKWTTMGYEGLMARVDGPYEFGEHWSERSQKMTEWRSRTLWKFKSWEDAEFVCVGVTQGLGKAAIGAGALVCTTNQEPKVSFNVNAGTDEERVEFMENPPIDKRIKVRYNHLTESGIPHPAIFIAVLD